MSNVNEIKKNFLCYGCGACNVVCSKNAITMKYDNIGRLQPEIDEQTCIDCGLCYKLCPSLDLKGIQLPDAEDCYTGKVLNTYIGKSTDEQIYRNSQSGGLVTAILKFLFDTQKIDAAIVCKVIDEIEYTPKATIVTSVEQLYDSQRSSYVPIDMVSAIKGADQYKSLAVVGTGCHIQGFNALAHFKPSFNERIKYKLGLICDRTLCKTATDVLYDGYFKNVSKRLIWRDKSLNYKNARILIKTIDNQTKQVPTWKRHALKDPFTNPRCRICFDKLNTGADVLFGDPWGMSNVDWEGGMSVVITRTHCGTKVISDLISHYQVELQEASLQEFLEGQHIEKRKKDVSSALAYYQRKGWLVPSYSATLNPASENPQLNTLIDKFVENSLQPQKTIIIRNIRYLRNAEIKGSIYKVIRVPINVIRRIIKK